jgi:hypothetical protein
MAMGAFRCQEFWFLTDPYFIRHNHLSAARAGDEDNPAGD